VLPKRMHQLPKASKKLIKGQAKGIAKTDAPQRRR
jgi:hypothetical protein